MVKSDRVNLLFDNTTAKMSGANINIENKNNRSMAPW